MGLNIGRGISIGTGITITFEYPSAPTNTVLPVISGTAQVRVTVNCSTGTWLPGIPGPITGYTYQWQLGTTNILGATSNSYLIPVSDVGQTLRCEVTATNSTGSTAVFTLNTPAILPNVPGAPTSVVATGQPIGVAVINFVPPVDDGGSAITSYTATSNTGGFSGSSASSPITVTGVPLGQSYFFNVVATNIVGNGPPGVSNTIILGITLTLDNTITGIDGNEIVRINTPGTKVYTVSPSAGIRIYNRNTSTGELTYSSTTGPSSPTDMTFSNDGTYIFALGSSGYQVRNSSTLAFVASAVAGQGAERFTITPDNKFLYSVGFQINTPPATGSYAVIYIRAWDPSTNTFGSSSTITFNPSGYSPVYNIFTSADGKNLYILTYGVTGGGGGLFKYDIDATTGALSNYGAVGTGTPSPSCVMSYDQKNIYIGGIGGNVETYSRNISTGNLTFVNSINIGSSSATDAMSIISSDNLLFTTSGQFNRNVTTGLLTFITGSSSYALAQWSVISPDDKNLYTVEPGSPTPGATESLKTYTIS